ncbi:uncharacterized protein isoform X2 [Leptinotarsa decemlineata]|uniref:uncharacterized protein isoform X2 n=1 Tax=Leptinotarsa decemlineata TaxID=7539 RepID=UPI003D30D01D
MDLILQVTFISLIGFCEGILSIGNFPRARPLVHSEEDIPFLPAAYYAPTGNKFYMQLSEINKKTPKYVSIGKLMGSFLPADAPKKCCGNEWVADDQEVHLVHVLVPTTSPLFYGYRKSEDVKPVTEYIEDDLQYDFRTKTHSIR